MSGEAEAWDGARSPGPGDGQASVQGQGALSSRPEVGKQGLRGRGSGPGWSRGQKEHPQFWDGVGEGPEGRGEAGRPGMLPRWGAGPREGETAVKFLLQLEMAVGERTCQWSGKPGEEPERASARRPHPPRLSPCSELYSARHTSFP